MYQILATHVAVDVANLDEFKNYFDQCGFRKLREVKRPGLTVSWYPGLELCQAAADAKPGVVKHVAWQVDDIDQAVRALRQAGVAVEGDEPSRIDVSVLDTAEVVRYIFFTTPVGLRGELYQVSPPETGRKS
ncbi:MAG: hypothetical protein M1570_12040 [Chloroflexi bacterium]|nr:hypothetical protein [Chloroflexota bacterium]